MPKLDAAIEKLFRQSATHLVMETGAQPVLQTPSLDVEPVERGAVARDHDREDAEQDGREGRPPEASVARGGSHPRSMPTPERAPHARTDSLPL